MPIAALVSVVLVDAMSVGEEKAISADFCHLTTLPTLPLRLKLAGAVPMQMDWAVPTVPPTLAAFTVTLIPTVLGQVFPRSVITKYSGYVLPGVRLVTVKVLGL